MKTQEINELFKKTILTKGIHKKLEIDKNQIANYRRRELSLGLKLELLLKLELIKIESNEPAGKA
jgi:hypothetical protein